MAKSNRAIAYDLHSLDSHATSSASVVQSAVDKSMKAPSEAAVQTAIRVRAGELGIPLFRNNVGACIDETGRLIRYGLANDSAQMSKRIKSGDLVGILPRGTLADPVPQLGRFLSIECKRADWQGGFPNPIDPAKFNDRERAQQKWIDFVREHGGIAGFARCVEEFDQLIKGT